MGDTTSPWLAALCLLSQAAQAGVCECCSWLKTTRLGSPCSDPCLTGSSFPYRVNKHFDYVCGSQLPKCPAVAVQDTMRFAVQGLVHSDLYKLAWGRCTWTNVCLYL